MPLSDPAPREALHDRTIECRGYRRADGLWDIEARLTDAKTYPFTNTHRGEIAPGEPLHDMWLRLTLDDDFVIRAVEAATDAAPFGVCADITPRFAALEGLAIAPGWSRKVRGLVGGAKGCTHLLELLRPVATVAHQTIWSSRGKRKPGDAPRRRPGYINSCHALSSVGEVVRQHFPEWYTGE
ncbi:MAG: DUF2889 domain-containing protein [Alphaproteobacteria bacterium]